MKKVAFIVVLAMLVVPIVSAQDAKTEAAQKSAESWLALVDGGDYAASYDQAAAMFKAALSKDGWVETIKGVRTPLGKVVLRKLQSAQYTTSLPGAPDGEYVVIRYQTSFENKKDAVETIVPMLDKDGQWRVSGYFIK